MALVLDVRLIEPRLVVVAGMRGDGEGMSLVDRLAPVAGTHQDEAGDDGAPTGLWGGGENVSVPGGLASAVVPHQREAGGDGSLVGVWPTDVVSGQAQVAAPTIKALESVGMMPVLLATT
ncbi:hypothetical protein GUJ93_ZPchr0006g41194 [Zizania palustris]|uniref:Uncharacterized protein n=1 Tax=Zizania palustris TaxID=103762 RepID=A0A8J5SI71_ZIZPA|nr:hypothetical protein GUJ93_ZPchr0006g41194 [Zizania palustris]